MDRKNGRRGKQASTDYMAAQPSTKLPGDPMAAMQFVAGVQDEVNAAFNRLVSAQSDTRSRLALQRDYREKATRLLDLLHTHNDSGMAPKPWNLTLVAQPLLQQSLMEADFVDATGDPAAATRLRGWAVQVANRELPPLALALFRHSMATQHAYEGRFNEALAEFQDLRQLFAEAGDVTQGVQVTLSMVLLLQWLGDHERALDTLTSAREAFIAYVEREMSSPLPFRNERRAIMERSGTAGDSVGEAAAELIRREAFNRASVELVELEARIHKAKGVEARSDEERANENDQASALWERVLPYYASIGGGPAIEYQLAAVDRQRGRYAEARERLERIEPAFRTDLLLLGKVAGLRLLQSFVALSLNEPKRALELANEGLAELETHPDEDLAWRLHWRRAAALRAVGRVDAALCAYSDAAIAVDSLRKAPLGYRLDSTALRPKLPLLEEAIALAADRGDGPACLRFIELVKARALSSALSVRAGARTAQTELEIEFDTVTRRLDALEYRGFTGATDGAQVRQERSTLLTRRIELIEQIRLRDPRWRGLSAPPAFDADKLATSLKARKQAAVTLYLRDDVVRSVLLIDGHFHVGHRTLEADVMEVLGDYRKNLLRPEPDLHSLDPDDLGLDAGLFVPADLLEQAFGASISILVAPHGQLHLLPWPAMPFGRTRLFERAPVGVVPNLTCALALEGKMGKPPRAALAGASIYPGLSRVPNLPWTGKELSALEQIYSGRLVARPLVNETATEDAVRALATRDDVTGAILHLSCHGMLSVEDPLGSGVLLPDGKIDAAEWAQMRLHYDEVVLSACSTGWRPMTAQGVALDGDDVLGLPGALLEAGARSIVVSIPKANDEATEVFMTAYHRRRSTGTSPLVAFCETQRELLVSGHAPYLWVGLICYGVY